MANTTTVFIITHIYTISCWNGKHDTSHTNKHMTEMLVSVLSNVHAPHTLTCSELTAKALASVSCWKPASVQSGVLNGVTCHYPHWIYCNDSRVRVGVGGGGCTVLLKANTQCTNVDEEQQTLLPYTVLINLHHWWQKRLELDPTRCTVWGMLQLYCVRGSSGSTMCKQIQYSRSRPKSLFAHEYWLCYTTGGLVSRPVQTRSLLYSALYKRGSDLLCKRLVYHVAGNHWFEQKPLRCRAVELFSSVQYAKQICIKMPDTEVRKRCYQADDNICPTSKLRRDCLTYARCLSLEGAEVPVARQFQRHCPWLVARVSGSFHTYTHTHTHPHTNIRTQTRMHISDIVDHTSYFLCVNVSSFLLSALRNTLPHVAFPSMLILALSSVLESPGLIHFSVSRASV